VVEVDIVGEHSIRSLKGLNGLRKDSEVEDLEIYRKN